MPAVKDFKNWHVKEGQNLLGMTRPQVDVIGGGSETWG